jgi:hypothetical protein
VQGTLQAVEYQVETELILLAVFVARLQDPVRSHNAHRPDFLSTDCEATR